MGRLVYSNATAVICSSQLPVNKKKMDGDSPYMTLQEMMAAASDAEAQLLTNVFGKAVVAPSKRDVINGTCHAHVVMNYKDKHKGDFPTKTKEKVIDVNSGELVDGKVKKDQVSDFTGDIKFLAKLAVYYAPLKPVIFAAFYQKWLTLAPKVSACFLLSSQ